MLKLRLTRMVGEAANDEFTLDFLTDAVVCALERWLKDKNCMPPEQLLAKLMNFIRRSAEAVQEEFQ